jgi:hypothetical protein
MAAAVLEDQANAYGIVLDVGFIGPLTRCRSGLTIMVATCGGYRCRRHSVLLSLRLVPSDFFAKGAVTPGFACTTSWKFGRVLDALAGADGRLGADWRVHIGDCGHELRFQS